MNRKNKVTFYSTIVLLVIFLPLAIIGTYNHFKDPNEKHQFHFDNKLYFYDEEDKLLGVYKCINSKCDYAPTYIIDKKEEQQSFLINNRYAFIKDGGAINLIDVVAGTTLDNYKSLATYSDLFENGVFLVKRNNLVGLIKTKPNINSLYDKNYKNISLLANKDGIYGLSNIVLEDEDGFHLVRNKEEVFKSKDPIVFADKNIVITVLDGFYIINDYEGKDLYEFINIVEYEFIRNYLVLKTDNNMQIIEYNEDFNILNSKYIYPVEYEIKEEEGKLVVFDGEIEVNVLEEVENPEEV